MADDPLIRQLSKFTPDAAGLDRDVLLFAAGKASARPNRCWKALAGALAATQAVTLGLFLLPAAVSPTPTQKPMAVSPDVVQPSLGPMTSDTDPSIVWTWHEYFITEDGSLPRLPVNELAMPDEPPMNSFRSSPWDLLN